MCFRIPHLYSKIPKIPHWSMDSGVHSVCFRGDFAITTVVGFLRKTLFQNVSRVEAIYSYVILLLQRTGLLGLYGDRTAAQIDTKTNFRFGNIVPKQWTLSGFIQHTSANPMHKNDNKTSHTIREVAQPSNDEVGAAWLIPMGATKNSTVALSSRNDMLSTPEGCADEWRQKNADFKLLCHEWFHNVRHHAHDGHCTGEFAAVIWRPDSFTVSSRGDVRGESGLRELASINRRTPQWARGRFTKIILPARFENCRYIKFWSQMC